MGIFTREEEEMHVYDADAFFYFAGAMLLLILIPWSCCLGRRLAHPRPPQEQDYDARGRAPKGAKVRRCMTSLMESRRENSLQAARAWKCRLTTGWGGLQLACVVILWICFAAVANRLSVTPSELSVFDPYDILGIDRGASTSQIKKAYRTKSLAHHPDKDRENPLAPALFQQITKAYAALTDDGARANYEKYGNPDGPSKMKVGIALHPAIVNTRQSRLTFLCCFFSVMIGAPLVIVLCCLRGTKLYARGVSEETLRMYNSIITSEFRAEDGPGLYAASKECRLFGMLACAQGGGDMATMVKAMSFHKPTPLQVGEWVMVRNCTGDRAELNGRRVIVRKELGGDRWGVEVLPKDGNVTGPGQTFFLEMPASELWSVEPMAPCPFSDAPIRRGTGILWAHMWRLHRYMDNVIQTELTQMLTSSPGIIRAMVTMATRGKGDRWGTLECVRGLIQFQRAIVQALDLDADPLLQLPHAHKLPPSNGTAPPLPTLREVVRGENGGVKALAERLGLTPQQRLDVEAFCRHAPKMELEVNVEVLDESEIADGDLATLTVNLIRTNLDEGEAIGPVHAPIFPIPKFEEWWVLLYDANARRFQAAQNVQGTGRKEQTKIRFIVPRSGEFRWTVYAMCDSYFGLDVEREVRFKALRKSQVKKDIFVHPVDANIKTLFEEIMEGLQGQEDSESEEEEWPANRAAAAAKAPAPKAVSDADEAAEADAEDVDDEPHSASSSSSDDDSPVAKKREKRQARRRTPEEAPEPKPKAKAKAAPEAVPVPPPAEREAEAAASEERKAESPKEAKGTPEEAKGGKNGEKKPDQKALARTGSISDSGSDSDPEHEGVLHKIVHEEGANLYREVFDESEESEHPRAGCIPEGTFVRGFVDGRPEGWMELAPGGAWIRIGKGKTEELGPFMEQKLAVIVQTPTPISLVKRWMRGSPNDITVDDALQVREIENERVRMTVEELARERMGEDAYERVQNQVFETIDRRRKRMKKALGVFTTQNGCVWNVTADGKIRGLHPDGSRIRDKVSITPDNSGLELGPFRLDESRTCTCIHWMRKDDPQQQAQWVWEQDHTLETRTRLGDAF